MSNDKSTYINITPIDIGAINPEQYININGPWKKMRIVYIVKDEEIVTEEFDRNQVICNE